MTITELMFIVLVMIALSILIIVCSACKALASLAENCNHLTVTIEHAQQSMAATSETPTIPQSELQAELDEYYKEQASAIDAARKIQELFLGPDQMQDRSEQK